ncbi:MAG: response regulator transcription factor [Gemmataceae bacterium]|nr:response regulator transcription factor [Gemmataceae bacterium]
MRILLILEQAQAVKKALRDEGLSVDTARSGPEGTQKAGAGSYDMIILDLSALKADGLELLKHWRRQGMTAHVLILAKQDDLERKVQTLDAGADDYLTKPFELAELLARVRVLLRRSARASDAVLRVFDLEIDTAARVVRRAGIELHVTPREYTLLHLLACHRGQVVTRSFIRRHLYDENDEITSNVVDVYVRYLRGKIDKGFDPPLILTRRGVGYMLRKEPEEPGPAGALPPRAKPARLLRLQSV